MPFLHNLGALSALQKTRLPAVCRDQTLAYAWAPEACQCPFCMHADCNTCQKLHGLHQQYKVVHQAVSGKSLTILSGRADFDATAVRAILPSVLSIRARPDVADGCGRVGC